VIDPGLPKALSVASPDEILHLARSRHADERFWGSPGRPSDYRTLGQRISWAPELQTNASHGQATVLEMIDAAKDVLWDLGVHVEIVRTQPECVVLRCRPRVGIPKVPAIELTKGIAETLPLVARGVPGTVVESSSSQPASSTCVMALLWKPPEPSTARESFLEVIVDRPSPSFAPVRAIPMEQAAPSTLAQATLVSTPQHAAQLDPGGHARRGEPAPSETPPVLTSRSNDEEQQSESTPSPEPRRSTLHRLRARVPWLFRRAWIVVLCACLAGVLAQFAFPHRAVTYTASAVLLVNPGANASSPGSAQEAANLAATYAGLIPTDDAIVRSVVTATGLASSGVGHDLAVTVQNGTSLLVVSFTSTSPAVALRGANAIARAISAPHPVTSAIAVGTLVVTKQATSAVRHSTNSSFILGLGVALGALLGVILAVALERADPRLDQAPEVVELLGIPTRLVPGLSDVSAAAIMRQWQAETAKRAPRVAFVGATPQIGDRVVDVAGRFTLSADGVGPSAVISRPRDREATPSVEHHNGNRPSIELIAGGAPGAEAGEVTAQQGDLVVLVIVQETKVRTLQRSVAVLSGLGISPSWALLTTKDREKKDQASPVTS